MTDTTFFATAKDYSEFVAFLTRNYNAEFALDWTKEPTPYFNTVDDIVKRTTQSLYGARFFILSPFWKLFPLETKLVENMHQGNHYSINQRYGGPAFDFNASPIFTEQQFIEKLYLCWFTDYPWYIQDSTYINDHSKYRTFNRPKAMTDAHKNVRTYLKINGQKSKLRNTKTPGPWVLKEAIKIHKQGRLLIGYGQEYSL
jgi:hypothetical protein